MTPDASFLNFAYGSNMSSRRLRARTPSAIALGCAGLIGHRLTWHKVGADGSGKCDIVETIDENACVWGVLYRIDEAERHLLDQAEGLGRGYDFKVVDVRLAGQGGQVVQAGAYVTTHVDGADEHGLPIDYCGSLRRVVARPDPDPQRRDLHRVHLRQLPE